MSKGFLHGNGIGNEIKIATGSFTKTGSFTCGFKPDVVYVSLNEKDDGYKVVSGVDFNEAGTDSVAFSLETWKNDNDYVDIKIKRTTTGFNVTTYKFWWYSDGTGEYESGWHSETIGATVTYRAVKYTEGD